MAAFFNANNKSTMTDIPYITLLCLGLSAAVQAVPAIPALTPAQEQAMQKDVEAIKQQALLIRTIRDAESAQAAFDELSRCRARQMMQQRHLQSIRFESRSQFRALQARYGWTEQDSMENKYQIERLASNHFYGVKPLPLLFGLLTDCAEPVADSAPADNTEALCRLLRGINSPATADAAATRAAALMQKTGITPAQIMPYDAEAEYEIRMLHAEYISLRAVDFYGSAALRAMWQ